MSYHSGFRRWNGRICLFSPSAAPSFGGTVGREPPALDGRDFCAGVNRMRRIGCGSEYWALLGGGAVSMGSFEAIYMVYWR